MRKISERTVRVLNGWVLEPDMLEKAVEDWPELWEAPPQPEP